MKPSTDQKEPRRGLGNGCPLYKKCGGCQLQNMDYAEQLYFKQGKVIGACGKYARVDPIIGMENPVHYRCKVQAAFGMQNGRIVSGVYQSSTHRIVPVDNCMLEDETADRIIADIRRLLSDFKLRPFREDTMSGFLRHVLVRRGYHSGQIMVVMVTGSATFPSKRAFVEALLKKHPEITTLVQNVNGKFTSLVLGEENIVLHGDGYIEDSLLGCTFRISPRSFYQVNPQMTEILYGKAIEFVGLTGKETVIDAYCGTGTIGLLAAGGAKRVIGVEQNADAIRDARWNAGRNGIQNADFVRADASAFLSELAKAGERIDALIMDPPRAGSDVRFLHSAVALAPERIVYVSCNPETLGRDLGYLVTHGYRVRKIQPVDMFPHTNHVECVTLMTKNRS